MSNKWTEEELKAAVDAYIQMHHNEHSGISFIKKKIYLALSQRFGRSEKAFEYRMQNISYIYSLMGRAWVSGLKPAKNIGLINAALIEKLIFEAESAYSPKIAEFETKVISYKAQADLPTPLGIREPAKTYAQTTIYERDPKVKAWVLKESAGRCECCGSDAPFITEEGEPFLEVHHLRRLADGGSDTVTNTVALCPNCHRKMHYGANKISLIESMYSKIPRLKNEKLGH